MGPAAYCRSLVIVKPRSFLNVHEVKKRRQRKATQGAAGKAPVKPAQSWRQTMNYTGNMTWIETMTRLRTFNVHCPHSGCGRSTFQKQYHCNFASRRPPGLAPPPMIVVLFHVSCQISIPGFPKWTQWRRQGKESQVENLSEKETGARILAGPQWSLDRFTYTRVSYYDF